MIIVESMDRGAVGMVTIYRGADRRSTYTIGLSRADVDEWIDKLVTLRDDMDRDESRLFNPLYP